MKNSNQLKNIKVMTMVRNDRFLPKWVEHYSRELGRENLIVFFDGEDQTVPEYCEGVETHLIPKMKGDVVSTDHQRSRFMSQHASELFSKGVDMVIATDADEMLLIDPIRNQTLREYLSGCKTYPCMSGLGVDVLQQVPGEAPIDFNKPFLSQRGRGWLHARYTKPSIITKPLTWGGGYHRVKGHNYHIMPDLYLFHFGGVDQESLRDISSESNRVANGWLRHQLKRQRDLHQLSAIDAQEWDKAVTKALYMQKLIRPIFALNKPSTLGIKIVGKIPDRFKNLI
ncbi:MAG: glycosyltransferase family 2 protein [Muribaculaceae bacterium]|nr:glycosyltransferase family 2 protein [Muribaculaceae bacterium]